MYVHMSIVKIWCKHLITGYSVCVCFSSLQFETFVTALCQRFRLKVNPYLLVKYAAFSFKNSDSLLIQQVLLEYCA